MNIYLVTEIVEGVKGQCLTVANNVDAVGSGGGGSSPGSACSSVSPGNGALPGAVAAAAAGTSSGGCGKSASSPMRPLVDKNTADDEIIQMMSNCWAENPHVRPDFAAMKVAIRKLNK